MAMKARFSTDSGLRCGFDRGLTLAMSLVQLSYDLVRIAAPIGHGGGDQDLDVIAAQQGLRLRMIDASLLMYFRSSMLERRWLWLCSFRSP